MTRYFFNATTNVRNCWCNVTRARLTFQRTIRFSVRFCEIRSVLPIGPHINGIRGRDLASVKATLITNVNTAKRAYARRVQVRRRYGRGFQINNYQRQGVIAALMFILRQLSFPLLLGPTIRLIRNVVERSKLLHVIQSTGILLREVRVLLCNHLALLNEVILKQMFLLPMKVQCLCVPLPNCLILMNFLRRVKSGVNCLRPSAGMNKPPSKRTMGIIITPTITCQRSRAIPRLSNGLRRLNIRLQIMFKRRVRPNMLSLIQALQPVSKGSTLTNTMFIRFKVATMGHVSQVSPYGEVTNDQQRGLSNAITRFRMVPGRLLRMTPRVPKDGGDLCSTVNGKLRCLITVVIMAFRHAEVCTLPGYRIAGGLRTHVRRTNISCLFDHLLKRVVLVSP